jgi:NADH-quinone oxidoreductase subunit F
MNLDERRKSATKSWEKFQNNERPVIFIGAATCGRAAGAIDVRHAVEEFLNEFKVDADIVEVGCIGPCYLEPLMDVKLPGKPRISYSNMNPDKVKRTLDAFFVKDEIPTRDAIGHFGEGGDIEGIGLFWDHPMLKPQVRLVLNSRSRTPPKKPSTSSPKPGSGGAEAPVFQPA